MKIIEGLWILTDFEKAAVIRLFFAAIIGGLIGVERELKGRPAGMKTFSLVCVGAAMVMITNEYIVKYLTNGSGDIARLAAQAISGIGFLGAGTIIVTGNNQIKGLTTAAALWVTAALGITIGAGFIFGGIIGILVVYGSSLIFRTIENIIMQYSRYMKVQAEGENEEFTIQLLEFFKSKEIHIRSFTRSVENRWYSEDCCLVIEFQLSKFQKHKDVLKELRSIEGIRFAEEI